MPGHNRRSRNKCAVFTASWRAFQKWYAHNNLFTPPLLSAHYFRPALPYSFVAFLHLLHDVCDPARMPLATTYPRPYSTVDMSTHLPLTSAVASCRQSHHSYIAARHEGSNTSAQQNTRQGTWKVWKLRGSPLLHSLNITESSATTSAIREEAFVADLQSCKACSRRTSYKITFKLV